MNWFALGVDNRYLRDELMHRAERARLVTGVRRATEETCAPREGTNMAQIIGLIGVILIGVLALRFGVDSRDWLQPPRR